MLRIFGRRFLEKYSSKRGCTGVKFHKCAATHSQRYVNRTLESEPPPDSELAKAQRNLDQRSLGSVEVVEGVDFKWVDDLMPTKQHPEMPDHAMPSGWTPPTAKPGDYAYYIPRTASHHLPVYLRETNHKLRKTIVIRKIDGDVWALEKDLRRHLAEKHPDVPEFFTEVNEVSRVVKVNGLYLDDIAQFLLDKGF